MDVALRNGAGECLNRRGPGAREPDGRDLFDGGTGNPFGSGRET
jgi:hypothetical protein